MYVCLCRGVTDKTISAEIARGACTVEEIAACTGAGTKCGRCRVEVAEMIVAAAEVTHARRVSLAVVPSSTPARVAHHDGETRAA